MSTSSFQSGLPAVLANRSQTALTTAAVARWMTPFSGPDPAQLAVADEVAPEGAHVGEQLVGRAADDQRPKRADGRDDDFGAAPDREREPVALEAVAGTSVRTTTYAAE